MATPVMGARGRLRAWLGTERASAVFTLLLMFLGILLMVLPAELITYEPPEKAALNLATTFSEL